MAGNNELNGKVAIVTGAGRNIGRAIALALADGGASILVNVRSSRAEADAVAREIEAMGRKALVHIGDVADAAQVQAMADLAVKHFGRLDILVNNAALRREKPFAEMSYAEWREIMNVTLDGAFHCVKACLPNLKILPEDLPRRLRVQPPESISSSLPSQIPLSELEKRYIQKVLEETGGNKKKAADILGIDRRTLYRMAARYGLSIKR